MEFHQILQKHIHMYMANTTNKKLGLEANTIGVISLCNSEWLLYRQFPVFLKESLMKFHQTLQTHSNLQDKYI